MALKNPAFWLVDVRSVKTRIRIVVCKFPYSDRLCDLIELATGFDKKNFNNSFQILSSKRKKSIRQRTQNTEAIYRRDFELKFYEVKSKK